MAPSALILLAATASGVFVCGDGLPPLSRAGRAQLGTSDHPALLSGVCQHDEDGTNPRFRLELRLPTVAARDVGLRPGNADADATPALPAQLSWRTVSAHSALGIAATARPIAVSRAELSPDVALFSPQFETEDLIAADAVLAFFESISEEPGTLRWSQEFLGSAAPVVSTFEFDANAAKDLRMIGQSCLTGSTTPAG